MFLLFTAILLKIVYKEIIFKFLILFTKMKESSNEKIIRMLVFSSREETNFSFIKNFIKKSSVDKIKSLVTLFKDQHLIYAKAKIDDLVCQLAYDMYMQETLIIRTFRQTNYCYRCGAALIVNVYIIIKDHTCWNEIDLTKFQFIRECLAYLLDKEMISIGEAKFLIWALNEDGSYKQNLK